MVGAHGSKLIANNRAATFFDRCVHKGLLELALVAPDLTYRLFDAAERQKLTIRAPFSYEEGCSIAPYHEGRWYVRRSDLEKLTAIPVTPVERAETEFVPARTPPAEPAETPRVEPGRDVGAADVPVQGTQVKPGGPQLLSAAPEPTTAADAGDEAGTVAAAIKTAESPPKKRLGTTGRPPTKRGPAIERMRADLREQRLTPDELRNMKQDALAKRYGCGREAACKARDDVLSEIVGNSISDTK
jgi:hypothetical protein